MGKVDDMRAWNEWREYHRALKRDKAVDKLSPVERMRRLEKLEKDPVSWMLFFFAEYTRHPFTSFQKKAPIRNGMKCSRGHASWPNRPSSSYASCILY